MTGHPLVYMKLVQLVNFNKSQDGRMISDCAIYEALLYYNLCTSMPEWSVSLKRNFK